MPPFIQFGGIKRKSMEKIKEALKRANEMHEVILGCSRQPENRPGTTNFDVCQAEKELSRLYVSMIEKIANGPQEMNDAILFSYWLMDHCELEEDNSLWSYDGEDYTNERLYEIWKQTTQQP